ncbi:hypothetical protein TEA_005835 [Camellia sinensis var. sinensis]|uniref:Uncharacterized protein n=1 Tax=Camellia sinensis var. sinensis TaxID=542762 RepID=A0A4S4EJP0_CAMSN|nr:hypothetical protein TEA_005835 [Camellia sinensis var. sinensis]
MLRKLFDMIEVPNQHNRLIYLALCFFRDLLPGPGYRERIVPNGDGSNKKGNWRFIPNTIELQEAGVQLVKIEGASLFDIKFEYGNSINGFHIALKLKTKEKLEPTTSNPEEPLDRERQPDPKQIWLWEGDEETVSSGEEEHGRSGTGGRRSNPANFHQGERKSSQKG